MPDILLYECGLGLFQLVDLYSVRLKRTLIGCSIYILLSRGIFIGGMSRHPPVHAIYPRSPRIGFTFNTYIPMEGRTFRVDGIAVIKVLNYFGDDKTVEDSARISFGSSSIRDTTASEKLIRYLISHKHVTPLEHCVVRCYTMAPISLIRQLLKNRIISFNEVSTRYKQIGDEGNGYYIPDIGCIREQSKSNKQGRSEEPMCPDKAIRAHHIIASCHAYCESQYSELIEMGVAKEIARGLLPLDTFTEIVWTTNLRNLLYNVISLRIEADAQYEIRRFAEVLLHEIVKDWCPLVYKAYIETNKERI